MASPRVQLSKNINHENEYKKKVLTKKKSCSSSKRFECQTCENTFSSAFALKQHDRRHTGEKPYVCDRCPDTFCHTWTFKNHLLNHDSTEEDSKNPFKCEDCGKTYGSAGNLKVHRRVLTVHLRAVWERVHILWRQAASRGRPHRRKKSCL